QNLQPRTDASAPSGRRDHLPPPESDPLRSPNQEHPGRALPGPAEVLSPAFLRTSSWRTPFKPSKHQNTHQAYYHQTYRFGPRQLVDILFTTARRFGDRGSYQR